MARKEGEQMSNIEDFDIDSQGILQEYKGKDKIVIIPEGVKEISFRTFYLSDICEVRIPQTVTFIDVQAFLCCDNLKYVVIPKSVKGMDDSVFNDCANLTDIFLEHEKGTDLGYDWDYGFKGELHWAGEWEYVDGVPKVKQ
ncbi:MAG: leucine-rich repeat domain-containing protein [Clostridia bacterium]|nr:leucine-rich repeat domain-containing protein [Clostridia bacterium]